MRVLVACEFSGVVRNAFLERGHDAYSCDLYPSSGHRGRHRRQDVRPLLREEWDLVIAHPPCTYLCLANTSVFPRQPWRLDRVKPAAEFFMACLDANSPRVCVENPRMHRAAMELVGARYSQIIHPWQFGHGEKKETALWLKGLPRLLPTKIVDGREERVRRIARSPSRGRLRSITYHGIAQAMAEQWGSGGRVEQLGLFDYSEGSSVR